LSRRSITFIEWTRSGAMNRKYALRVSVFALAFGLALLPAPFVNFDPVSDEPAAVPTEPPWPSRPFGGDTELNKIRYQAEVTEVAELRKSGQPIADDGNDSTWWSLCGAALLASLVIPAVTTGVAWLFRRGDDGNEDDDDGDEAEDDVRGPARAA